MKRKILVLLLSLLCFFINCSFNKSKYITLSTNIAVFSAYIEYYNSIKTNLKIQMVYKEEPVSSFQDSKYIPDILIFENLSTVGLLANFEPLNKLLKPGIIPPESIYTSMLETGVYKRKNVLLPLSFSLPMILFNNKNKDSDIVSLIIPLETIKTKALKFNSLDNRKFGFSPFWNAEFIFSTTALLGTDFRVDNNKLIWNKAALNDSIIFFKNWIKEIKGEYEAERQFSNKYMNIPPYKLLEQERILYYFTSSDYLFNIPKEKRKNIEFRWLSYDHKIPVNDNITYIGIPKKARYKKEASEFIQWLFRSDVQSMLMKVNNYKQISGIFGIANKFSSLVEVNEKYIPQYSPFMVGHIPEKEFLLFPAQLPDNWKKVKDQIIKSWLINAIIANDNKNLENLLYF